jgi:acetyltransferase-like isoleucine patch superfamily enzyme
VNGVDGVSFVFHGITVLVFLVLVTSVFRMLGQLIGRIYVDLNRRLGFWASTSATDSRGKKFGAFGERSMIMWKPTTIFNERYISIGSDTLIGPDVALSAGMVPGQECISDIVVSIGDRCLIGRGSGIVGHFSITIGNDVWTGHHVYITDQNHGYEDVSRPISQQSQPERAVVIGDGSWLGYGAVVLPGVTIGKHVVIGANSVVTHDIPDYSVAVGSPARVVRRHDPELGWVTAD